MTTNSALDSGGIVSLHPLGGPRCQWHLPVQAGSAAETSASASACRSRGVPAFRQPTEISGLRVPGFWNMSGTSSLPRPYCFDLPRKRRQVGWCLAKSFRSANTAFPKVTRLAKAETGSGCFVHRRETVSSLGSWSTSQAKRGIADVRFRPLQDPQDRNEP